MEQVPRPRPQRLRVTWTANQPEWPEDGFAPDPAVAVYGVYAREDMDSENMYAMENMERAMRLRVMSHRLGVMEVMSHRLKKGSLFMKLARKQFDYKFRLPAPRYAPDVLHEIPPWSPHEILPCSDDYEIPPWSPRSDDYEFPDDYEYVSDDEGDEEFSRDANQHFGFLGLDEWVE